MPSRSQLQAQHGMHEKPRTDRIQTSHSNLTPVNISRAIYIHMYVCTYICDNPIMLCRQVFARKKTKERKTFKNRPDRPQVRCISSSCQTARLFQLPPPTPNPQPPLETPSTSNQSHQQGSSFVMPQQRTQRIPLIAILVYIRHAAAQTRLQILRVRLEQPHDHAP